VGSRASLSAVEKKNISHPCQELNISHSKTKRILMIVYDIQNLLAYELLSIVRNLE
jgi:hypothetical protein